MGEGCCGDHYASASEEKGNILDEYEDDIIIPIRDQGEVLLNRETFKPSELQSVVTNRFWNEFCDDVEEILQGLLATRKAMWCLVILFAFLVVFSTVVVKDYLQVAANCAWLLFSVYFAEVMVLYHIRSGLRILLHTINVYCRNSVSGYVLLLKTTGGSRIPSSQQYIIFRKVTNIIDERVSRAAIDDGMSYGQLEEDQFRVTLPRLLSTFGKSAYCHSYHYADGEYYLNIDVVPPGLSPEAWRIFCEDLQAMYASSTKNLPWAVFSVAALFTIVGVVEEVQDSRSIAIVLGTYICCCWIFLVFARCAIQQSMDTKLERINKYGNSLFSDHNISFQPAPVCTAWFQADSVSFKKRFNMNRKGHV